MPKFFKFLPRRKSAGSEKAPEPLAGVVPPSNVTALFPEQPSRLLKDVLIEDNSRDSASQNTIRSTQSLAEKLNIGRTLSDGKEAVARQLTELASALNPDVLTMLSADASRLEAQVCRIAFVGQMNAGKSSLINVLVEQTELLPADINPWTTVVTQVHFGVPGAPTSGASFKIFDADEWRRLSTGGRVRELTEKVIPNFNWDLLNEQVNVMKQRAEQKLGSRFNELLGSTHTYPAITPGLINRYVGAGEPSSGGGEGEFADITKIASIYFDLGAFNFPTIVIDTPGVNDPFLVRDEITRQSLENVDVCVVVVTARQPISHADLQLLRLLRGLKKDRLIVFVNKVDEIEADPAVLSQVVKRIEAVLFDEFGSTGTPIVVGSALWARAALSPSSPYFKTPDAKDMATANVLPPDAGWDENSILSDVSAQALFSRSGLPSLALAVSDLMRKGPVALALDSVTALIASAVANTLCYLKLESAILRAAENGGDAGTEAQAKIARAIASLQAALTETRETCSKRIADEHAALGALLRAQIDEFAAAHAPEAGSGLDLQDADLRLRMTLENNCQGAFQDMREELLGQFDALRQKMQEVVAASDLKSELVLPMAEQVQWDEKPKLAALGEPSALGTNHHLSEMIGDITDAEERRNLFISALTSDFYRIADSLVGEADSHFADMTDAMIARYETLALSELQAVMFRLAEMLARAGSEAETGVSAAEGASTIAQRLEEIETKIRILEENNPRSPEKVTAA